uniref:Presqualene diphosphate phosphatase n=1 Tax=Aceria tosichella TaxID=561515 RepID=A0A6G1SEZ2_9ACAR
MSTRKPLISCTQRHKKIMPRLKPYLVALEWSCNGLVWLASAIIIIVSNSEQTSMVPKLLIGLIVDVMYVATIKALARRRRPTYAYQRDQLIVASVDKHSFPSGHCSRAAYVALFTRHYFGQSSPFFTFMVSLWAGNVCASRVLLGRHHILDCVAGIVLGWFNYTIQFHSPIPVSFLGMLLIRSVFGAKAFSDPNDMDGTDAFID